MSLNIPSAASRALGLVLGYAADRLFADPVRFHPVAGFGQAAGALEARVYADTRPRGAVFSAILVGSTVAAGVLVERGSARHPLVQTALTGLATWTVLGGTSLDREATAVHGYLASGDLAGARLRLTHLVGRDTSLLSETEIARATIESVAENTSDAVTAPLVLGAFFGIPGLVGYRAANTLDAMVGHRNARYERFGWASARLDDVLNLGGARVGALLTVALAPTVDGSPIAALQAWRSDARHHPSPNAGPIEAAFAGALDITLGGVNTYGDRSEDRHTLGIGRPPVAADIDRARGLANRVAGGSVVVAAVFALLRRLVANSRFTALESSQIHVLKSSACKFVTTRRRQAASS